MGVSAQKRSRRSEVIVTAFSKISKFPQTPQNKHHLRTNHLPQRSLPNMPHNSNGAPPSLPHCSAKSSWRVRIWYPTFPFFTFSQPRRWQAAGLKPSTFWRAPPGGKLPSLLAPQTLRWASPASLVGQCWLPWEATGYGSRQAVLPLAFPMSWENGEVNIKPLEWSDLKAKKYTACLLLT